MKEMKTQLKMIHKCTLPVTTKSNNIVNETHLPEEIY